MHFLFQWLVNFTEKVEITITFPNNKCKEQAIRQMYNKHRKESEGSFGCMKSHEDQQSEESNPAFCCSMES